MGSDESGIVRKCQAGDWSEFGQLYDRYVRKIYGFVYFKTMHREDAEDLTSQTFIKAIEKIQSFDPDTNLSAWLFAIARNAVIDHFRTQKREVNIEDCWSLDLGTDIGETAADRETVLRVRRCLDRFKPTQREIILLRIWGGMSFSEIAAVTGKSEGSVKMSFSRHIREIRREELLRIVILGILIR
jgi:RNA polymerase sigma-70 factor (ECF subfamily)